MSTKHHVRLLAAEGLDGFLAGAGLLDGPALVLERELDRLADALVVLDGQDSCPHVHHDARIPTRRDVCSPVGSLARPRQQPGQPVEDAGCRGQHLVRHGRSSGEVADAAAGLAGDQLAGGHVPCVETRLEVRIEAPRRDVAQVERGRPEAADVAHVADQVLDHGGLSSPSLRSVREPGGDERSAAGRRGRCRRSARRSSVAPPAAGCGEQLADGRHVDSADERSVGVGRGHRRRPRGHVVDEVRRAVDRIDEPRDARRSRPVGALLADDCVVGTGGADRRPRRWRSAARSRSVTRSVAVDFVAVPSAELSSRRRPDRARSPASTASRQASSSSSSLVARPTAVTTTGGPAARAIHRGPAARARRRCSSRRRR